MEPTYNEMIGEINDEMRRIETALNTPIRSRPVLNLPEATGSHQPRSSTALGATRQGEPAATTTIDVETLTEALSRVMQPSITVNMPKLPVFSGDGDDTDWAPFIELFEEIMELNGWNSLPSRQKVSLLRSSLTKRASDAFNGFSNIVKTDYDLAKNELQRVFVNPAKAVLFQNEFDNRIQRPNESLQELVTALRRVAKRGYPEVAADPRALDSFVHRRFIEAIRDPKLRQQVRLFRRDTVEQTLVEAYRLQAALASETEKGMPTVAPVSTKPNSDRSGGDRWTPGRRTTRTCYVCGKPGHISSECWYRADRRQPTTSNYGRNFVPPSNTYQTAPGRDADGSSSRPAYNSPKE